MMHFSCDYCGKDMTQNSASRYVVKMEAFAAAEPADLTEDDLDADHVEEMARLLNEMDDTDAEPPALPMCKKLRFDLCAGCFGKFVNDPLSRENVTKFDFSQN